ncbi:WYL domain-containing protein, partial [Nocardioides sp. GCM10030258]|uniref:WYL domain-containing protein n=1 Tax=unclassified Nocardioides TaxID=2615069 RepID=UPI00361CF450
GTPTTTGQRFAPREVPGGDAVAFVNNGLRNRPQRHQVRVRMTAPAADVEAYMGRWGTVEATGDTCVMTMNTDSLDWPVMVLANLDCDFTVEEPAELVEVLARVGRRFTSATS